MLADYEDWTRETVETAVEFEHNSTAIMLNLPSLEDWDMKGRTLPLVVSLNMIVLLISLSCHNQYKKKQLLNQNRIQSNMQFILRWKGPGYPSMEFVTLHLSGALQPKEVTFFTNTS